jgi:hypothetical protein
MVSGGGLCWPRAFSGHWCKMVSVALHAKLNFSDGSHTGNSRDTFAKHNNAAEKKRRYVTKKIALQQLQNIFYLPSFSFCSSVSVLNSPDENACIQTNNCTVPQLLTSVNNTHSQCV